MPIVLILIGILLMVTAYSGTYAQLATELESDIPGFMKWGLALGAIVAVGFIPGLQKPARWLLGLVILVIVLKNWSNIAKSTGQLFGTVSTPVSPNTTGETQGQFNAAVQSATQAQSGVASIFQQFGQ